MTDLPKDLIEAIAEGRVLIVCGAGVSRLATGNTAPGWAQLINLGLERAKPKTGKAPAWVRACQELLKPDAAADDWLEAADTIQDKLGGHKGGRYRDFLREAVGELNATNPESLLALKRLGEVGNRIATTNYDDLLREELKLPHTTWSDPNSCAECL